MPNKVPIPSKAQIDELRNKFLEKYKNNAPEVPFHPDDMNRIKNGDLWCIRFLEMYDLDMSICLEKLWETCIWRRNYGTNDLNENNIRRDYLMDGAVFTHNKDKDGKPLLIFQSKNHTRGTKDMEEVMRVVVYWIERIQRETDMSQMTLVFDMDGTGLSNMDLDFVKRIVDTFKLYYPNALNYILVFELAWMLNAAFKIIKGLLPAKALEILKMITKKDINTYIDKDNCLKSWGGNDDYKFTFEQEKKVATITAATKSPIKATSNGNAIVLKNDQHAGNNNNHHNNNNNNNNAISDKRVHFANSSPVRWPQTSEAESFHSPNDQNMLQINPIEFLVFSEGENSDTNIDLTCTSRIPVIYKIQTTSPEKFRVRPRCGILMPNNSICVNILLKSEHHLADSARDKFLIMCAPAPADRELAPQQIADIWKQKSTNSPDIEQHRLCCVYKNEDQLGNGVMDAKDTKSLSNISELSKHAKRLERQLQYTQILQYMTLSILVIVFVAVIYLVRLEMDAGQFDCVPRDQAAISKEASDDECFNDDDNIYELIIGVICSNCDELIAQKCNHGDHGDQQGDRGTIFNPLCDTYQGKIKIKDDDSVSGGSGGGHLFGLIALARKITRIIMSMAMLFSIVLLSYYFCFILRKEEEEDDGAKMHKNKA